MSRPTSALEDFVNISFLKGPERKKSNGQRTTEIMNKIQQRKDTQRSSILKNYYSPESTVFSVVHIREEAEILGNPCLFGYSPSGTRFGYF